MTHAKNPQKRKRYHEKHPERKLKTQDIKGYSKEK